MSATDASQQANRASMDRERLVVISYLLFGIIIALFMSHLLEMGLAGLGVKNAQVIEGAGFRLSEVLGFALTLGLAVYCWMTPRIRNLSNDVAEELMRVTWPSWEETRTSTVAVVIASLVAAVILFAMDTVSLKVMVDWLPKFWRGL